MTLRAMRLGTDDVLIPPSWRAKYAAWGFRFTAPPSGAPQVTVPVPMAQAMRIAAQPEPPVKGAKKQAPKKRARRKRSPRK